jgi:hypothetical protein
MPRKRGSKQQTLRDSRARSTLVEGAATALPGGFFAGRFSQEFFERAKKIKFGFLLVGILNGF